MFFLSGFRISISEGEFLPFSFLPESKRATQTARSRPTEILSFERVTAEKAGKDPVFSGKIRSILGNPVFYPPISPGWRLA